MGRWVDGLALGTYRAGEVVNATRVEITSGRYMGEEGTGYRWGVPLDPGDFSSVTRGHYQGGEYPCRLRLLVPGSLAESIGGDILLYVAEGTVDAEGMPVSHVVGIDASEAVSRGLAEEKGGAA